jgi:beta-galactosidase
MRPLLDGPLFGAFGAYGMDGSRTPRSEMMSTLAHWGSAPEHADLWDARPARGEIGIVVVPESQLFAYAQQGNTAFYAEAVRGAYQGFFDAGLQPDWVLIDHIDEYRVLYLPFPAMLPLAVAERLRAWVEAGGILISEGCPGYFGDGGRVGTVQPNHGLDELFGAREAYVEFTPDLLGDLTVRAGGRSVPGGIFLQAYTPTTGTPMGTFADESAGQYGARQIAVVDNLAGQGRTRLIGTFPGYGHFHHPSAHSRGFFADLAAWANIEPNVRIVKPATDAPRTLVARIHVAPDRAFLWLVNHARDSSVAQVELGRAFGSFVNGRALWGDDAPTVHGRSVVVEVGPRDAVVIELTR